MAESIGCFEVEYLEGERWRLHNTLTGVSHVYYGNYEEVVMTATRQSEKWEKRYDPKKGILGTTVLFGGLRGSGKTSKRLD